MIKISPCLCDDWLSGNGKYSDVTPYRAAAYGLWRHVACGRSLTYTPPPVTQIARVYGWRGIARWTGHMLYLWLRSCSSPC